MTQGAGHPVGVQKLKRAGLEHASGAPQVGVHAPAMCAPQAEPCALSLVCRAMGAASPLPPALPGMLQWEDWHEALDLARQQGLKVTLEAGEVGRRGWGSREVQGAAELRTSPRQQLRKMLALKCVRPGAAIASLVQPTHF